VFVIAAVLPAAITSCAGAGQQDHAAARQPAAPQPVFAPFSLAPARGVLFGAWVQPASYASPDAEEQAVTAFERIIGRRLAINNVYVSWTGAMPVQVAAWDVRSGAVPMISWAGGPAGQIASGADDALIRARARQLKSLPGPVLLRWFPEMDSGPGHADAGTPATFVAAWRRMHELFALAGATNVRWVWCPTAAGFAAGTAQAYYPGKAYVNWIGADGYNWAPELAHDRWRSFTQIFSAFYRWALPTGEPLLVGEFGTVEGAPGAKAAWFTQAGRALRTLFPSIRAVVYFESDHENFGQFFDWRVTTSPSSLASFRAFARDRYLSAQPAINGAATPAA
jgi:hypothetical protein